MCQRDKIIQAIASIDADIAGLNEIENNPSAAVDDLLDGFNELMGDNSYDGVDTGFIGLYADTFSDLEKNKTHLYA